MPLYRALSDWLETHWVAPAYAGGLLLGLTLFYFGAAINTMAGWLYVMSGLILAMLLIAALMPPRSLRGITVKRQPIHPVSAGDTILIELQLTNQTAQPKTLIQVQDMIPAVLGSPARTAIEHIPSWATHRWVYDQPATRRGVYRWETVQLRTAAPLGLFWCRRSRTVKTTAVVYPTVLPLTRCPLVDELGQESSRQIQSDRRAHLATEGLTRALRPYRWGDPIRLIHWRTSARYGELRVRELERFTSGQEFAIGLDSGADWQPDEFEQAVVAAASLYEYALRQGLHPWLWTAATGLIRGERVVLESLAAVHFGEVAQAQTLPNLPLTWLTSDPQTLVILPAGSRWLLWPPSSRSSPSGLRDSSAETGTGERQTDRATFLIPRSEHPGLVIQADQPLEQQLQMPLGRTAG